MSSAVDRTFLPGQNVHKKGTRGRRAEREKQRRRERVSGAHLLRGKIVKVPGKRHVTAIRATGPPARLRTINLYSAEEENRRRRARSPRKMRARGGFVSSCSLSPVSPAPPSPLSSVRRRAHESSTRFQFRVRTTSLRKITTPPRSSAIESRERTRIFRK